jgi:hypothetical protein
MAYDYPTEKISVYISDDGGSALTLFAFMEAAKFATHWLPFCKKNNILERSPEALFESNHPCTSESEKIKVRYCNIDDVLLIYILEIFFYIKIKELLEKMNKIAKPVT